MSGDPIRLLEDPTAGSLLRGDLAAAGQAQVQGLDLAAGLGSLQAALGAETGASAAIGGSAGGSMVAKAVVASAVLAGALWWVTRPGEDGSRGVAPPVASAPPSADAPPTAGPGRVAAPPAPSPAAVVSGDLPASATPDEPVPETESAPDEEDAAVAAPVEPEPHPRARTGPKPTAGATIDDSVVREAKKIQAARRALATDAARALAITEAAADEFPHGQLVEERRALAIQALAKLGRMDQARKRAESFLAEHGRGPHAAAVRRAIDAGGE